MKEKENEELRGLGDRGRWRMSRREMANGKNKEKEVVGKRGEEGEGGLREKGEKEE